MKPIDFLQAIAGYTRNAPSDGSAGEQPQSTKRPIRLAKIDPAYDAFISPYPAGIPTARVTFEGESTLSGKYYAIASGLIPYPNQRVYLIPVGTTYMIAGAVSSTESQGFYGGTSTGVEFGDGNYFDVVEGLSLSTDAEIGGALSVGGFAAVGAMRLISNEKVIGGAMAAGSNATTSWANLPATSSLSFTKKYSSTFTKLIITMSASLRLSAGTPPKPARIGVNLSSPISSDYEIGHQEFATTGHHLPVFGIREITGVPAATYTIQGRYRAVDSGVTFAVDANDYISLHVKEVSV